MSRITVVAAVAAAVILVPTVAAADAPAVIEAATVDAVDLSPPQAAGAIDLVHLHAPAIDAFASLTLAEQPYGANGRRYTLTNAGKVEVVVWTFSAMRAGNGPLAFDTGEMSNLEPGEAVTKYLVYHPGKTHPWGQYRLVVVAVEYRRWGDIVTQSRTRAGRKVDALERALEAKMKAFAATFGK